MPRYYPSQVFGVDLLKPALKTSGPANQLQKKSPGFQVSSLKSDLFLTWNPGPGTRDFWTSAFSDARHVPFFDDFVYQVRDLVGYFFIIFVRFFLVETGIALSFLIKPD